MTFCLLVLVPVVYAEKLQYNVQIQTLRPAAYWTILDGGNGVHQAFLPHSTPFSAHPSTAA